MKDAVPPEFFLFLNILMYSFLPSNPPDKSEVTFYSPNKLCEILLFSKIKVLCFKIADSLVEDCSSQLRIAFFLYCEDFK